MTITSESATQAEAKEPWLLYLSDRADGVKGRYAIARWNPAGYREVWNLRRHEWGSFSDDVLTLDEAHALLKTVTLATAPTGAQAEPVAADTRAALQDVLSAIDSWGSIGLMEDRRIREARALLAEQGAAGTRTDEVVQESHRRFGPLVRAAINLVAAVDERHAQETPLKYTIPYGAVSQLRDALTASPARAIPEQAAPKGGES